MFDFNMADDPTGPSDHIRSTLAFLDNNIRMLKKLSQKFQEIGIKYLSNRQSTPILFPTSKIFYADKGNNFIFNLS